VTGRRERRRVETAEAIVRAATIRFTRDGYEETSIETIAADAGVSPGTVYNYFGTKGAVLLAVVAGGVDDLSMETTVVPDGTESLTAILGLIEPYVETMAGWGKHLLRTVIAIGFDPTSAPALEEFAALDEHAITRITAALDELQGRGDIAASVDVTTAAMLVYSIVGSAMLVYASDPAMTQQDLTALIAAQLDIVWRGLAPGAAMRR
jgi:AcrR family transcriptional regulator